MEFKEGQVYEYMDDSDSIFDNGQRLTVETNGVSYYLVSKTGSRWFESEFDDDELRLVEGGNKMLEFKEGQLYEYVGDSTFVFDRGQRLPVIYDSIECYVLSKNNVPWYAHEFREDDLRLVEGDKSDSTSKLKPVFINVENLMEHILVNKLEVNEILSYLDGYVEGSRY